MSSNCAVLNLNRIQEATGGDPEFLRELMDLYLTDAKERLDELRSGLIAQDPVLVARCAHKMKGSSSNVGAERIERIARRLEKHAHEGDLSQLDGILAELEAEIAKIPDGLAALTSAVG